MEDMPILMELGLYSLLLQAQLLQISKPDYLEEHFT